MSSADTTVQPALQPSQGAKRRIPRWRFLLPLALQLALILPIPLRNTYTAIAGETLILKTEPVDPYNLLQGYYQVLRYETISDQQEVAKLEGGEFLKDYYSTDPFYLVFAQVPVQGNAQDTAQSDFQDTAQSELQTPVSSSGPTDWQPVRISQERPDAAANELFIKAYAEGGSVYYNLERYYMPESQRNELNQTISDLRRADPQAVRMEVKVDRFGGAVPVALLMDGRRFEF